MSDDYPAWRTRLANANDPAFWPITEIDARVADGRAQFWCDGKAALVTEVVPYPGGAVAVEALAAAGDIAALMESIAPAVEQWARANKATHLRVLGRPGWVRRWSDWRHEQSVIVKELA